MGATFSARKTAYPITARPSAAYCSGRAAVSMRAFIFGPLLARSRGPVNNAIMGSYI